MPGKPSPSIAPYFSRGYAANFEKVTRAEIDDMSGSPMFFYSCNPDPGTKVTEQGQLLAERSLYSQWKWLSGRLDFFASILSIRASFMMIMPEQTADGNIHFHAIVKPHNDFSEHDIKRTFWQVMECNVSNAKVRKHAVNVKPINDSGVVDYLFHKDAHDYETIFHKKINNIPAFEPLLLTTIPTISNYTSSTDSSEESEEESTPPTRVFRQRPTVNGFGGKAFKLYSEKLKAYLAANPNEK